jgi:hypothetical protein
MADEIPTFTCNHWDRVYSIAWIAYVDCDKDLPHGGESLERHRDHQRQALHLHGR